MMTRIASIFFKSYAEHEVIQEIYDKVPTSSGESLNSIFW